MLEIDYTEDEIEGFKRERLHNRRRKIGQTGCHDCDTTQIKLDNPAAMCDNCLRDFTDEL